MDPSASDLVALAGVFLGGLLAAYIGYARKTPPPSQTASSVVTGVGFEIGNRIQMDQLIGEVKRIADALTDKNAAGITDRLEDLADRVDEIRDAKRVIRPRR